jgi:hypothetical protein
MLEQLQIIDFQFHHNLTIDFDPHITTITADGNDCGKSTCLRALRWVCTNKSPKGEFIRWDADTAKVKLKVGKHFITRRKGKGGNLYFLDGNRLEAPGKGLPPEPIVKILNLGPQNWQRQLDNPFWFLETPGAVSKELNQIVNLELIDKSLASISSRLRQKKIEHKICKERLAAARERKQSLSWVVEKDAELKVIEDKCTKVQQTSEKHARMVNLTQAIEDADLVSERARRGKNRGVLAVAAGAVLFATEEKLKRTCNLIHSIEDIGVKISSLREERKGIESQISKKSGGLCPICGKSFQF